LILGSALIDDRKLERWIVDHRVSWLNWPFEQLSQIGRLGLVFLVIAAVLAVLRRRPSIFVVTLAVDLVADLLASGIKDAIPRARPHVSHLIALPTTHSFPSGHAATSFACATVLAAAEPRGRIAFFVLAAAIAYSRLYNGVHYPLDVLGGAVLGILVALTALRLLAARRRGSRRGWRRG
jgi:undecaprenyl-diphosphatase